MDALTVFILVPYIKCTMNGGSKSHSPGAEVRGETDHRHPSGAGWDGGSFPSARVLAAEASLLLDFLSTVELLGNTWWAWQKACHKITRLADTR